MRFAAFKLAELIEISQDGRQVAGLLWSLRVRIATQMVSFTGR
jgi:hypothetical protein